MAHKTVRVRASDLEFLLDLPGDVSVVAPDDTVAFLMDIPDALSDLFPESSILKYELSEDLGVPIFVGVDTPEFSPFWAR